MNVVEEDLRHRAASSQLLHPGSQLWMPSHIHVTYRYSQTSQGGFSLHTVWAALDGVHCYPSQSTALNLLHLQQYWKDKRAECFKLKLSGENWLSSMFFPSTSCMQIYIKTVFSSLGYCVGYYQYQDHVIRISMFFYIQMRYLVVKY